MKSLIANTILVCFLALSSCVDDPEIPPSVVTFESDITYVSEFDGTFYVPMKYDKPQFGYSDFNYEYVYVNPPSTNKEDFGSVFKPSTIFGNEIATNLTGVVIDDTLKDGNDTLRFTLKDLSSNLALHPDVKKRSGMLVVVDDDKLPANELLIQLKWIATGARVNRNDADFQLELVTDVKRVDGEFEDYTVYRNSNNINSFESIRIDDTAPDKEYYVFVTFKNRSASVTGKVTTYLKFNGFGFSDWKGGNRGTSEFEKNEIDYFAWYGPFKKTGRTFVRVTQ